VAAGAALAQPIVRIATYNVDMSARGPGLVLQSLAKGGNDQQKAVVDVIAALNGDILLLTGLDYDARGQTLSGLADLVAQAGLSYPHQRALRPNSGLSTGFDVDGNGRWGQARDAMAYGRYPGEGGMAILSKFPIGTVRDFTQFLWADLPQNLSPDTDPALRSIQRLSSNGHYEIEVDLPNGDNLRLLAYGATPPVFDGPDDRNGKRNHDETAFWLRLMAGELPFDPPKAPFVVIGQTNLDPMDGEGRAAAVTTLMSILQDPKPMGTSPRVDQDHKGDPRLDTALYDGLGGVRVVQILPSPDMTVINAGVIWPPDNDPMAPTLATASHHRPVWVDVRP
jgi:hypothetical protein